MRYIPALDDGRPQVSPADLWAAKSAAKRKLRAQLARARRYAKERAHRERLRRLAERKDER